MSDVEMTTAETYKDGVLVHTEKIPVPQFVLDARAEREAKEAKGAAIDALPNPVDDPAGFAAALKELLA